MKKAFVILIVVCGIISCTTRAEGLKSGYRGFVDFSWTGYNHNIDEFRWHENHYALSTVHGYQIVPRLFVGAGLEFGKNSYLSSWYLPVFADLRTDLQFGRFSPFVDCRVGWTLSDDGGFRFQPTVGYRFCFGHKFGINVGVGCTLQNYRVAHGNYYNQSGITDSDGYIISYSCSTHTVVGFSVRFGIDF